MSAVDVIEAAYADYLDSGDTGALGQSIAAALTTAGLLAPSPLRVETGTRWDGTYVTPGAADTGPGDEPVGELVRRYVTEWETDQ